MSSQTVHIKNMVCDRCIMVVESIFKSFSIDPISVSLGEVKIQEEIPAEKLILLNADLIEKGFELIDDKKRFLSEKVKSLVIEKIHHTDHFVLKISWSNFLQEKLEMDYSYLSSLFSSVNGITLEQYIIRQKIEKVKEYLFYNEFSIKEIAFKLGYSSVGHLSNQFKKVTGLSPSEFKESRDNSSRKALDQV